MIAFNYHVLIINVCCSVAAMQGIFHGVDNVLLPYNLPSLG